MTAVKLHITKIVPVLGHDAPAKSIQVDGEWYEIGKIYEVSDKFYERNKDLFKKVKKNG